MGFEVDNQISLEEGLTAYDITDKVLEEYKRAGFSLPRCPQVNTPEGQVAPYQGQIPEDPSTLSDTQLAQYMGLLSQWLEYVGSMQTMADIAHKKAIAQLDFTEATIQISYKLDEEGKKRTISDRDMAVKRDRRFVQANSVATYTEAYLALTATSYRSAQQNYKVISRRITQRGQELDRATRNGNAATGAAYTPGTPMFPGRRS